MKNLTITVSGDQGAGKTHLLRVLSTFLAEQGYTIGRIRDGGGPWEHRLTQEIRDEAKKHPAYNGRRVNLVAENKEHDNLGKMVVDLHIKDLVEVSQILQEALDVIAEKEHNRALTVANYYGEFHMDRAEELGLFPRATSEDPYALKGGSYRDGSPFDEEEYDEERLKNSFSWTGIPDHQKEFFRDPETGEKWPDDAFRRSLGPAPGPVNPPRPDHEDVA